MPKIDSTGDSKRGRRSTHRSICLAAARCILVAAVLVLCFDGCSNRQEVQQRNANTASDETNQTVAPSTTRSTEPQIALTTTTNLFRAQAGMIIPAKRGEKASSIPERIDGYVKDGPVEHDTVRVFEGDEMITPPARFDGQMNKCGIAFWTARWEVLNPDVVVHGVIGGAVTPDAEKFTPVMDQTPAATAGYLADFICAAPAFHFAKATNGNQSNLVDVVIEWQYWRRAP